MDSPELEAFLAVAETASFSTAAEQLHLTQPAVSRRLATLERRLESRLFDRVGRRVALTEAGAALLPRARRILQELDDTRTLIANLAGTVGGALALATSHHVGLHRLPPVLRRFSRAHPEVTLDLRFMDSEAAHEQLLQGRLELAVVTLAPHGAPGLLEQPVWHDPLAFVVAPDHPLVERMPVALDALEAWPAILPGLGTYTGRIVAELFERRGLHLEVSMSTNYLETIRMMVAIGLGWSVLPVTMLDPRLVRLELAPPVALERTLGAVRHPARTLSNAGRAFLEALESDPDSVSLGAPGGVS